MSTTDPSKPRVLVVSFSSYPPFTQQYEWLLGQLNAVTVLDHVTEPESAIQGLADQPPQAVLVTDGGISQHRRVYAALLTYVRSGGMLILMGNFTSLTRPSDMNELFREAGLPWTFGEYQRTTVHRNDTEETSLHTSLLSSYIQKAVFLSQVPNKDA